MLIEALRLAWQAIGRNALRASLTVLGIVIGVAAVIAMVTIGKGATAKVTADIERLGGNLIFLVARAMGAGPRQQRRETVQHERRRGFAK